MPRIEWDRISEHIYETGIDHGVLYTYNTENGEYDSGVPWNGLTAVTESSSGAEANDQYADNIKYVSIRSAEDFGLTIEAFTYPKEFEECNGTSELFPGITIAQQSRKSFGFSYRTLVGNDTEGDSHGYKIHLVYGATASPSEMNYQTVNDSPEPINFSWEVKTTPVQITGYKPSAQVVIDSTKVTDKSKLEAFEDILYGTEDAGARLPLPTEIVEFFKAAG